MNTRFAPVELANKILQIAISNANKPDAKDIYKILRELEINKEMTCFADSKHLFLSDIEEKFQTPLALALNASYKGLVRSSNITNTSTYAEIIYNLNEKIFNEKLLPDIEATYKSVAETRSFSITEYFQTLFTRKSPAVPLSKTEATTTSTVSSSKAMTI